uniref:RNase H type-1 domain-containing protein n=1 Tax=Quercus lobata TaxID=97700 RepID=A0A7N2R6F2_QUELO
MKEKTKVISTLLCGVYGRAEIHVFNRKNPNPNLPMEIYNQTLEFMYCVTSPRNPVRKTSKRICWEKPPSGWKKLNTDGSSIGCMEQIGCGGVIRDEHGNWVVGFLRHAEQLTTLLLNFGSLGMVLCCVVT